MQLNNSHRHEIPITTIPHFQNPPHVNLLERFGVNGHDLNGIYVPYAKEMMDDFLDPSVGDQE